jgi:predicted nucleic acid-binding protein
MADLVIDASLASAWCFPDERTAYANGVLRAVSSSVEAFAPRLWAYEVRNSVLMGLRRGRISKGDAEEAGNPLQRNQVVVRRPGSHPLAARCRFPAAFFLRLLAPEKG